MDYLQIVRTVILVLSSLLGLLTLHFFFFALVGIFKKRTFPKTDTKLKYGVIIPARNEEAVVANLIESVRHNDYPQDQLQVFVIAHNCTDRTAEIARQHGATVYEYNNPEECTMGYAFRYLFDRIREDWGISNYDGFFLFNADNVLAPDYFSRMNDAFVACGRQRVITSFRNSTNFGENLMSAMYGLYFMYGCRFESRGRTVLGCSTRVQGTGYVVSSDVVRDGWKYVTLTEDWEFTADQILRGNKIVFCDDAVFYDEQPTGFRVMWRQRLRWSRGHLLVCLSRFKDLVRGLFLPRAKGGAEHKMSTYDILVNILPFSVISAVFALVSTVMTLCAAFFGVSFGEAVLHCLLWTAVGFVPSYFLVVLSSVLIYIIERKRIHGVTPGVKIASAFLWPFFLLLSVPSEICALFMRNLGWKSIPHTGAAVRQGRVLKRSRSVAEARLSEGSTVGADRV